MSKKFDYQKTKEQLDQLLAWFESGEGGVDESMQKYKKAEELINQLQEYLNSTKAKVDILTKSTSK